MKRLLLFAALCVFTVQLALAQLPNGSTAPNWTMTDIDGQTHTLYNYLDDEKVVFLDFSATWCGPCWNYHNTHAFRDVYNEHGPPGTNNVMAFMIEGDDDTNLACLYGPSGCNNTTMGNWVAGTPYPIFNDHNQNGPYQIGYWPTIYGICPDKKITEVGQVGSAALWNFAQGCSAPQANLISTTNIECYGQNTGSITVDLQGGISPFTYAWSNGASTQNLTNLSAGNYTLTVTGSLGGTSTLGPIAVTQPQSPLTLNLTSITHAGCSGLGGMAQVAASGGTAGYSFLWSHGATTSTAFNLQPGTYSVTTTDANGCTEEIPNIVIDPPTIPTAIAASPNSIDCINNQVYLSGVGTTTGSDISYVWTTSNGNIVSGANTLNDCLVDEAGDYTLLVLNTQNACQSTASTSVTATIAAPSANAGPSATLDCVNTATTLIGSASVGSNFEYLWTTTGGNIVSGATTLTPVVDAEGDYTLTVTNTDNGCTSESTTQATEDTNPPNASATDGELNCTVSSVTLEGNSTTAGVDYEWSGPNNFSSTEQNVMVSTPGTYTLTVTDNGNGCTTAVDAEAVENTTPPQASAMGGTITCTTSAVTLEGSSTTSGVSYEWTGPGSFSSTQQNPEVGTPGSYNLTVTGTNGCTETAAAIVDEDTAQPTADAGENGVLNCNATSLVLNGSASSSGSQFNYEWTTVDGNIVSGANTTTPTVDATGTYEIMVTNDDNGCTSLASADVTQTPEVNAEISSQTNIACYGGSEGAATVSASGGDENFTYAWSTGANTASVTDLSAGTYTVVVTDGEDCSVSETVEITQPDELTVMASSTAQTAPGVDDGTATANANGGTGTLSYLWSNGETTATITGLAPGNYTVDVTDENGCVETQTVTVNEFGCAVTADISATDVSCNGDTDGTATIELNNAAAPLTYLWSNDETTAAIEDLAPGTYSVTASDDNGCEVVTSVDVGEPAVLNANTTSTAVTAAGADDGTATANPTGGTAPFTYEWSNGETTQTITDLPSANYTVIVTDANGCTAEQTVPVAPANCAIVANIASNNVSCNGANDGQATVTLTNGLSPFTYQWSNDENTATVQNLAPGTYTVEVTDAVNCPAITEVTITEPEALEADVTSLSNADCGQANGAATVEAQGGTQGYEYVWSNGLTGASQTTLDAGTYTVEITDANDCTTSVEVEISVEDNEAPVAMTQDVSVEIGAGGTVDISPQDIDAGSSDNCEIVSMEIDVNSFDCNAVGDQQVTLTVTDGAGNSSSSTAIVTVTDNSAPGIAVQGVTVSLDANGQAAIQPAMLDAGSTDNCGIVEMSVDIADFGCDDMGDNAVVLTVTDGAGNSSSGTAIVTVVDEMAPTADCPTDMNLSYCDPVAEYSVLAEDNCSDNLTYQWSHESGSNFPIGETQVEVTVTDESGNTTNCSFIVTVPEEMEVTLGAQAISCAGLNDGSLTANVSGGTPGYTYLWSNGETGPTLENVGAGTYSLEVTDAEGCVVATNQFILEEPTAISATVVNTEPEVHNQSDGVIDLDVTGGTVPLSFEWTDEMGNVVSTSEDLIGVPAGTYTLTVVDANGCTWTEEYTVQQVTAAINKELAKQILLYPNPTQGEFTLAFDGLAITYADVRVFDLRGQLVNEMMGANLTAGQLQLDLTQQSSGIYVVKIRVDNHIVAKRVVVSK